MGSRRTARTATASSPATAPSTAARSRSTRQDFTVFGGSLGEVHGQKIAKIQDFALRTGVPLIGISDGGGARIQEGVAALTQFAEIFRRNVAASGVIPQISIILGPSAGGAVYSPALTDFIVMADGTSQMFITGPDVIKSVTGEEVTFEELGGGHTHNVKSGVAHYLASDEDDAIDYVQAPAAVPAAEQPLATRPRGTSTADLEPTDARPRARTRSIPDSDNQPYDMKTVIEAVLDDGEFFEIQPLFATNIVVGFGHVEGHSVGIVANQPLSMAGTLDINAAEKAARFVRTCDAFNIPVLTFVDVPGFLPGTDQEYQGIIRRGAKLIFAYAEATVPLVTVITRKAYGGAYIVMASKQLGADINLAWPTAQIAVMGAGGAVNILQRRALAAVAEAGGDVDAERARLAAEYEEAIVNPYDAADRGYVDAVIEPSRDARAGGARRCARSAPSAPPCRPRSTGTSRCERATTSCVAAAASIEWCAASSTTTSWRRSWPAWSRWRPRRRRGRARLADLRVDGSHAHHARTAADAAARPRGLAWRHSLR